MNQQLPLSLRATAAWTLAYFGRHDTNWGRMLDSRSILTRFLRDPHPHIRRLAEPFMTSDGPSPGRAA